jgi:catechol-2,3-dioxygenase
VPVTRLNHAVLYVRDVGQTRRFYEEALGFEVVHDMGSQAVFLRAPASTNDHDLAAFAIGPSAGPSTAGQSEVGLYHLAWEVDTLAELSRLAGVLRDLGALVGASDHQTTKALYAKDPDGLEFEVCWIVPAEFLTEELVRQSAGRPAPLDLAAEIERYGGETRGGVGVSMPAPS